MDIFGFDDEDESEADNDDWVSITNLEYIIPAKKQYAMWRFQLSNGRTVWMNMDYDHVPSIGTQIRCKWPHEGVMQLDWPMGNRTYWTTFEVGRFCI